MVRVDFVKLPIGIATKSSFRYTEREVELAFAEIESRVLGRMLPKVTRDVTFREKFTATFLHLTAWNHAKHLLAFSSPPVRFIVSSFASPLLILYSEGISLLHRQSGGGSEGR